MREYWILTKLSLLSLFSINKARHSRDEAEKKKSRKNVLLLIVMIICLGNMSFTYSFMLSDTVKGPGSSTSMLLLIAAATSVFLLMVSILSAKSILFSLGDYDTLMSWPAPRWAVTLSRISMLYVYNLFYGLLLLLPAGVVYALRAVPPWTFYPMFLILSAFVPAVPTALGALIGTLTTFLTARMKKRTMVGTAFQMLLFVGIILFSYSMNSVMDGLGQWAAAIRETLIRLYPPLVFYADACVTGKLLPAALFLLLSAAILACSAMAVSKCFLQLSTRLISSTTSADSGAARFSAARAGTLKTMYVNEWKRYLSSSSYVMNTAFGTVVMLLLSAAMIVKRAEVLSVLAELGPKTAGLLLPFIACFITAMSSTTGSSVSMEGKRLWIVKSLPVDARSWMLSKVLVSLTVALPGILLFATVSAFLLPLTAVEIAFLYLVPAACALLMSVWGLAVNLRFPKLDWRNETEAVKQSMATMITVFSSMGIAGIPAVVAVALGKTWVPAAAFALFLLLAALLFSRLVRNGQRSMLLLND